MRPNKRNINKVYPQEHAYNQLHPQISFQLIRHQGEQSGRVHQEEKQEDLAVNRMSCPICLKSLTTQEAIHFSTDCNHFCCKVCFQQNIDYQLKYEQPVKCFHFRCNQILNRESQHLGRVSHFQSEKYNKILSEKEVPKHHNQRPCPKQNCRGYIDTDQFPIKCTECGQEDYELQLSQIHQSGIDTYFQCSICLTLLPINQLVAFSRTCKHLCCKACLRQHINYQMKCSKPIKCFNFTCSEVLKDNSVHITTMSFPQRQKYKRILLANEVNKHPNRRFCTKQYCQGYITTNKFPVKCTVCEQEYCRRCLQLRHKGQCQQTKANELQRNLNLAKCKKCKMLVQKLIGCNQMVCLCGHQFCFLCNNTLVYNDQGHQAHICVKQYHMPNTFELRVANLPSKNDKQKKNQSIICQFGCFMLGIFLVLMLYVPYLLPFDLVYMSFTFPISILGLVFKTFYFDAVSALIKETCADQPFALQKRIKITLMWVFIVFPFWHLFTYKFRYQASVMWQTFNAQSFPFFRTFFHRI